MPMPRSAATCSVSPPGIRRSSASTRLSREGSTGSVPRSSHPGIHHSGSGAAAPVAPRYQNFTAASSLGLVRCLDPCIRARPAVRAPRASRLYRDTDETKSMASEIRTKQKGFMVARADGGSAAINVDRSVCSRCRRESAHHGAFLERSTAVLDSPCAVRTTGPNGRPPKRSERS
jgi:hypothetical protein